MNVELTSVKPQQLPIDRRTDAMETYATRELIVLDSSTIDAYIMRSIATLRIFGGRNRGSSRRIASFWLSVPARFSPDHVAVYAHASGIASGGGYCRQSAAASDAMTNAGLSFNVGLHGAGMSSIDSALEAIARFYGFSVFYIARG